LIYFDASVLVPLLVADTHTRRASAWYSTLSASVIVSDLASLEVSAVLSRDLRTGRLTLSAAESALLDFDAMRASCERLSHGAPDFVLAERMVRDFSTKLAAADALHLASVKNASATLATFDARLAEAAKAKGVEVAELG
jgi:predicted nucleic acid-binding protein